VGAALLNPFVSLPSLLQPTGKWGSPDRLAFVRDHVPGLMLIEDGGLAVATGREPIVDDLFLWSRLYANGRIEGVPLLAAVQAGTFDAVVSEVELERIDAGPGYERQRWHPDLVSAVLQRYQLTRSTQSLCRSSAPCQLHVYTRR